MAYDDDVDDDTRKIKETHIVLSPLQMVNKVLRNTSQTASQWFLSTIATQIYKCTHTHIQGTGITNSGLLLIFFYSSSLCYFRFFVVTIVVVVVADFLFVLRVSYAKRERERERSMWIYFCVERAFDVSFMYT